ncbi:MAG: response regulator [Candidatus Methanoplasma sp.]|jgi:CheY-like chemotaxis protein|nr:response regulator [Candidatus Methanoplasma sp.]
MRVLVIDDCPAVREAIGDALEAAGHRADLAGGAEEAIEMAASEPDAILLDAALAGERGTELIGAVCTGRPGSQAVVLMTGRGERVHLDNPLVRGSLQKPFRSGDLLEKLGEVAPDRDAPDARKGEQPPQPGRERRIEFGKSYMMFGGGPGPVYSGVSSLEREGCAALVVTARRPKTVRERVSEGAEIVHLSFRRATARFDIYKLGTAIAEAKAFAERAERPVIAFDDLDPLIKRNGMDPVLRMMHQILTSDCGKKATVIASADPKIFSVKDIEILLSRMEDYCGVTEA